MYNQELNGKLYIFSDSPLNKNWVFPSDLLWYDRWVEILHLRPQFVEIISWNDYGESYYIGPLSSLHTDDGSSRWTKFLITYHPHKLSFNQGSDQPRLAYHQELVPTDARWA
ncbi:hypothetical protein N7539_008072 [Penicillium diatomitis]|uniref:Alpha-1,3-glucanase n=1 Tax=Penicillium diatomitis TaxID=2819901 RepID=A0A9W9WTB3_9EURO|nr:uncharacterized protein N7539_008072 [Penicillium diatomitis]KAJ5475006.1 hypothetical protein N7539_008072 [Penicillium diatomitis]